MFHGAGEPQSDWFALSLIGGRERNPLDNRRSTTEYMGMRDDKGGDMTKAFMSTAGGQDARDPWFPISATADAKRAVHEAERILAETQAPMPAGFQAAERCYLGPMIPRDETILYGGCAEIMREALAAILPVLDELAADATTDAAQATGTFSHFAVAARNAATLAAMDAGK